MIEPPRVDCGGSFVASFKKTKEKAMDSIHRLHGASCLTRTGDTLINSQVL